jgi:RNA polymerase sigma-70 factor (ECF subfamily)
MQSLGSRLARGDESAFTELYDAVAHRLHRFLSARLRSTDAASDVLQTVFLRAVEKRRHFRRVENPVAYLFRIASNEAARVRTSARVPDPQASLQELPLVNEGLSHEDTQIVMSALLRLDARDREIIELKIFGGLTFGEVAESLSQPLGTVATRYRRALESLRPWLSRQLLRD